jgi:hypothetical protein
MTNAKILITVDTEVGEGAKFIKDGFEKFILGEVGEEYFGVPKIVETLDEFEIKAEFFTDVYEYKFFGESKYNKLCNYLNERGHGVQLHTHPSYAYDLNRVNMYEYSLEEQITIIKEGKELIKKWIGEYPIAHRAGNYGADNNTLIALKYNGIQCDSSYFYSHRNCNMKLPVINDPINYEGILEIPVTVIEKRLEIFGFKLPCKKRWIKLDIDLMTLEELINGITNLLNKYKYTVLFLHSFSFIETNMPKYDHCVQNIKSINKFRDLLVFLKKNEIECIRFEDVLNQL